ncbi:MAG: RNA polymerase sigma-70 factor (ECF subfamily) [Bacteriovoracaceae bacterium]|jgi:RNA polymerase sigma-70 factor (ECF subfamily)
MGNKLINILNPFYEEAQEKTILSPDELLFKFKAEYESSSDFVRKTIYWNTRNKNDLDDLVQDTFLKAWKAYPKFNYDSDFKTWIYRIARNTLTDYFRKEKIFSPIEELGEVSNEVELQNLITVGLTKLNEKQREIFILHYYLSYTQSEISELTGISEGTIKSRIYKAKEIFKDFVEANGREL